MPRLRFRLWHGLVVMLVCGAGLGIAGRKFFEPVFHPAEKVGDVIWEGTTHIGDQPVTVELIGPPVTTSHGSSQFWVVVKVDGRPISEATFHGEIYCDTELSGDRVLVLMDYRMYDEIHEFRILPDCQLQALGMLSVERETTEEVGLNSMNGVTGSLPTAVSGGPP